MKVNQATFFNKLIEREFSTAHIKNILFAAVKTEEIDAETKKGIKKSKGATFIKDSDWIILFANKEDLTPNEDDKKLSEDTVDTTGAAQAKLSVAKALTKIFPLEVGENVELHDVVIKDMKMFFCKIQFK